MKEVEVKARLKEKEKIVEKLKSLGCIFENEIFQNDTVYTKNVGSLEAFRSNKVFLRIRIKNNNKIFFTLKKRLTNDLDALEYETEISSKEEMEQALLLMDYNVAVKINKKRLITHYNDCEICIDDVEDLGSFIEMEKLCEEGDAGKIQDELFNFLLSVGIKNEDRVNSGYDILMLEKKDVK